MLRDMPRLPRFARGCCWSWADLSWGNVGGRGLVGVGGGLVCAPDTPARPWILGFLGRLWRQGSEHLCTADPAEPSVNNIINIISSLHLTVKTNFYLEIYQKEK